eukprot:TRINITY_DN5312_c0_g2_i5.p1 TRINITY_DN5312_c0_g2~~TRINITY_DN5312_c0_g2_i5.p1  ORF type:complete len:124 (+),score=7.06 TRINITY_DN5312_c0_g2_i5:392-763(+)
MSIREFLYPVTSHKEQYMNKQSKGNDDDSTHYHHPARLVPMKQTRDYLVFSSKSLETHQVQVPFGVVGHKHNHLGLPQISYRVCGRLLVCWLLIWLFPVCTRTFSFQSPNQKGHGNVFRSKLD